MGLISRVSSRTYRLTSLINQMANNYEYTPSQNYARPYKQEWSEQHGYGSNNAPQIDYSDFPQAQYGQQQQYQQQGQQYVQQNQGYYNGQQQQQVYDDSMQFAQQQAATYQQ